MRKLIYIFIFNLLISGCVNEKTTDHVSENNISDKDFQNIIKNIWLTNAHIFNNKKFTLIPRDSVNYIMYKVIQEKGINKEEFEKSIKYYSQNPELLDSILKDLRDSLEEVFIGISHDEIDEESNSNEIIKDLLKENSKFIKPDIKRSNKRKKNSNVLTDSLNIKP
mgnify:CR=1 FL=1